MKIHVGERRVPVSLETYEKVCAWREERSEGLPVLLPLLPHHEREVLVDDIWTEETLTQGWKVACRLLPQNGRFVIAEVRVYPKERIEFKPGEWSGSVLGDDAECPAGGLSTTLIRKTKLGHISKQGRAILSKVAEQQTMKRDPKGIDDLLERAKQNGLVPKIASESDLLNSPLLKGDTVEDHLPFGEKGTFGSRGITSPKMPVKAGAVMGRKRIVDDLAIAKFCRFYLKRVAEGSHRATLDTLANFKKQFPHLNRSKMRSIIFSARERGFLERLPDTKGNQQGQQGGVLTDKANKLLSRSRRGSAKPSKKVIR